MAQETTKIGKRGTVVIPVSLRQRCGFEEGTTVIAEECDGGILLRAAVTLPVEIYSRQRRAEFLLSNATDPQDYAVIREEVRKLGIDPDSVPHYKPGQGIVGG